mgnify:CR=1 FL=1
MSTVKVLLFDIDGVITDGKKYTDGKDREWKSIALKDLDAFYMLKEAGYIIGCITGENTDFSEQFIHMQVLDYVKTGCKQKDQALQEVVKKFNVSLSEICYIGDGKYDIPVLNKVGLPICPSDAIEGAKKVSKVVLSCKGGEGCIAEAWELLSEICKKENVEEKAIYNMNDTPLIKRMMEHRKVLDVLMEDKKYMKSIMSAIGMIIEGYRNNKCLFLCGNGGSAADAQHLAAELVGRFYLERKALNAEALTVNTSILTSLANDYDYNKIFERQLEAKAMEGDVLIGISTSGTSKNVLQAFRKAREMKLKTILMTGDISQFAPVLAYTDCLLAVPSNNTPRIQEIHILTGHIICEMVEGQITNI